MKMSKTALMILAVILVALIAVDHFLVSSTEEVVQTSCRTKVAYDKSGSMYCKDTEVTTMTVANR